MAEKYKKHVTRYEGAIGNIWTVDSLHSSASLLYGNLLWTKFKVGCL
jgi:hypothetical protein